MTVKPSCLRREQDATRIGTRRTEEGTFSMEEEGSRVAERKTGRAEQKRSIAGKPSGLEDASARAKKGP
mgnify:CR=1 FL=1